MARAFLDLYRYNPKSILEYLGLKDNEKPYFIPNLGVNKVIMEIKKEVEMSTLPTLTEEEEEVPTEQTKPPPPKKRKYRLTPSQQRAQTTLPPMKKKKYPPSRPSHH